MGMTAGREMAWAAWGGRVMGVTGLRGVTG
jgi:hypothetical protein